MAMLASRWAEGKFVCAGLDPVFSKLPIPLQAGGEDHADTAILEFSTGIINAVGMSVCAFKPNVAFFSGKNKGLRRTLAMIFAYMHHRVPGVPTILDAKRADIGNTNAGYAAEAFEEFNADAVTVNPYLGEEALKPFLDQENKGIIVLCRTSNPGAREFQNQRVAFETIGQLTDTLEGPESTLPVGEWSNNSSGMFLVPLYQLVALRVARHWNKNRNCALVVGATAPQELATVRQLVGDMPILVPGIGAQGGELKAVLEAGLTNNQDGLIINASRSILFAFAEQKKRDPSVDEMEYPAFARAEVDRMNLEIQTIRCGG